MPEGVVPLYDFDRPDPLQWEVDGLVPKGHLTMLIADGGTGKSFLALHLAMCIASGQLFLGRDVDRGRVLYIDHELDADEQRRRVWRVATGMGLSVDDEAIRERLFYIRPRYPLGTDDHHIKVLDLVDRLEIDFVVLDSLTMGAAGDVKDQADFVPIAQQIRQWPTTLAIDHVSHATARGSASNARAFGSVFKRNAARSSLTLAESDTGGYVIQQEKSNFNSGDSRLCYATTFEEDAVTFERIDESDERAAGLLSDFSSKDVTLAAVKDMHEATGDPVFPDDVATWRENRDECDTVAAGTVENHFVALRKQGDLVGVEDSKAVRPSSAEYESEPPF
jgi:RecA-family ATPase